MMIISINSEIRPSIVISMIIFLTVIIKSFSVIVFLSYLELEVVR